MGEEAEEPAGAYLVLPGVGWQQAGWLFAQVSRTPSRVYSECTESFVRIIRASFSVCLTGKESRNPLVAKILGVVDPGVMHGGRATK